MTSHPVANYHSNPRDDLLPYVLALKPKRVLDVGCADGSFGESLKRNGVGYVAGIDTEYECYQSAKEKLDHFMTQDCQNGWWQPDLECGGTFDVVVFADVLEHLRDPWAVVRSTKDWLSEGGSVVASIPNVGFIDHALKHLCQMWQLSDAGIMDKTHLRWFCREDIRALFEDSGGYTIDKIESSDVVTSTTGEDAIPEGMTASVDFGLGGGVPIITMHGVSQDLLDQLYTTQYICVAHI